MTHAALEAAIESAWEARDTIPPPPGARRGDAIESTLDALDSGTLRVAERDATGTWVVRQWARRRSCSAFGSRTWNRSRAGRRIRPGGTRSTPSSRAGGENQWRAAGFRAVPGSIVRGRPISQRAWC